ncbi:MAG: patatin-like phospholipase family protein [Spirochaetaceae bacterium]|nr:patatin-like phospholipase family protein [Spirochaetaceae bacterium]
MPKRYLICTFLLLAGIWGFGIPGLQPVYAQETATVFPEDDPLRMVVEPIQLGIDKFSARIEQIKASGREPLGLVLTGGSARAYAHIGVLETLEAEGIRPDFIVANSMGALIGMLYSAGVSPQTIRQIVETTPPEQYLDIVMPTKGGLLDSSSFSAMIRSLVGDIDLADTPIPIIVTAEDLKTRRQVELAEGDFPRVIAATFAMPAIFEPVSLGDLLLIDGGVANLAPVAIAARYSSLLIVSTALYNREMSFGNPLTVINRAIDIGKTRNGMEDILAVQPMVIRNEVEDVSYMAFSEPELVIELGRKSAAASLEGIKARLPEAAAGRAPDPVLEAKRQAYAVSIPARMAELSHGALPACAPRWSFRPILKVADDFEPEPMALSGQAFAGISLYGASGRTRYGFSALYGMGQDAGRQWGLSAQSLFNPVGTLRLSGALRLWGDFVPLSSYVFDPESLEALAVVEWSSLGPEFTLSPRGSMDATMDVDNGSLAWVARLGLSARLQRAGDDQRLFFPFVQAYAGMFADSAAGILRYGPEAVAKLGISRSDLGAVRLRGRLRYDIQGLPLGLESSDSFRGVLPTGSSDCVGVANSEIVWFARALECSLGEMLLVKDIELGPYFDCAWAGSASTLNPDAFAAGLTLSLSASISGLKPFELSVFGGIGGSGDFVLGLRQGRLF